MRKKETAPSKEIRIPESKQALLVESGIPLTFEIRNPDSIDKESRIHFVESRIQDCIGYPYMRRNPGVLLGILRGVCPPGCPNSDPIPDPKMSLFTPVLRPGNNVIIT